MMSVQIVCHKCHQLYNPQEKVSYCPHLPKVSPPPVDTTSQLNENWRTYSLDKPFKNGCEAFNVLSPMPTEPLDLGAGRELHICQWQPTADENIMGGNDFLTVKVEGFIRLKPEMKQHSDERTNKDQTE